MAMYGYGAAALTNEHCSRYIQRSRMYSYHVLIMAALTIVWTCHYVLLLIMATSAGRSVLPL